MTPEQDPYLSSVGRMSLAPADHHDYHWAGMSDSGNHSNALPAGSGLVVAMDTEPEPGVDPESLRQQLARVIEQLGLRQVELNVVIVGDEQMADLHQRFSGVSGTTDVLTFDLRTNPPATSTPGETAAVDGEVYICVDEARRRAAEFEHPVGHELLLYATHGLLHLLGYDDHDEEQHRLMHEKEDQLLTAIGIGAVFHRVGEHRP